MRMQYETYERCKLCI